MTCKQCGSEVPEGQRFCGHCGADQQAGASQSPPPEPPPKPEPEPQPNPQTQPQPNPQPSAGGNPSPIGLPLSTGTMILKVFAAICAVVYGVLALVRLVNAFAGLFSSISLLGYRFFGGLLSLLSGSLMLLLFAVVYAWMCVVMLALFLRRDGEGTEPLFLGLCVGGVLAAVLSIVRVVLLLLTALALRSSLSYYNWSSILFMPILGAVVAVGGVFLLLYLLGDAPLLGKSFDEIKALIPEIFEALKAAFASAKEKSAAKKAAAQPRPGAQVPPNGGTPGSVPPAPPAPPAPGALKTNRSLVAYILLSIITCGIYGYYFLYTMARDVNVVCSGDGKKTGGLLAFILLSYVTCGFYALYWYYSLGNRLAANAPRYGLNFQENGTTVLLWYLVGLLLCGIGPYVAMHFLIRNTNTLCAAYNQVNGLYGN